MNSDTASLVTQIQAVVGSNGVIEDPARGDGPIVRPSSTEEIATVLRLCNDAGQPVVAIGGNTTMVKGTERVLGEIAISLERMNKIEEIDHASRTMTVQAGAILQTVQETAAEHGFLYPLDLGARGTATIGGNISTNAGGNRVIRYGMTRDQVLAVEAVLADGTIVPMQGKSLKNNTGYDLKHLFISGEGTLGIVTRATLRLRTLPVSDCCGWVAIPSFDALTKLLNFVEAASEGTLSSFEVMWANYYEFITGDLTQNSPPVPYGHPFTALIEFQGMQPEENQARFERILMEALENELIADAVIAKNEAERAKLWHIRDDVHQAEQLAPIWAFDISLAISEMESYVNEVEARLTQRWPEHHLHTYGHLGDGNLHLHIAVGENNPDTLHTIEEIVYDGIKARNGSISAEHGIGFSKKEWLPYTRSSIEIDLMKRMKQVFDPRGILNPGKIFNP